MKAALSILLVFATAMLRGSAPDLPKFDSNFIGHPPLSLGESGKWKPAPHTFDSAWSKADDATDGLLRRNTRPATARIVPAPPRFSPKTGPWKMPILEPNPNIDHKIVLKEPDPNIDPKMVLGVKGFDPKPAKSPQGPQPQP